MWLSRGIPRPLRAHSGSHSFKTNICALEPISIGQARGLHGRRSDETRISRVHATSRQELGTGRCQTACPYPAHLGTLPDLKHREPSRCMHIIGVFSSQTRDSQRLPSRFDLRSSSRVVSMDSRLLSTICNLQAVTRSLAVKECLTDDLGSRS